MTDHDEATILNGIRALLLINTKGHKYLIKGGIKVYRIDDENSDHNLELSEEIFILNHNDSDDPIVKLEHTERKKWFDGRSLTEEEHPNRGPFIFQAFNVLIPNPDEGSATITGNSNAVEGL